MENEEVEEPIALTPFRVLLHRAISFLRREEEAWEQEMLQAAIQNSMETYHETLFVAQPERKISIHASVLDMDRDEECHLCLENMKQGDQVIILPCEHVFHAPCVDELISHQHLVCPLCRETIPTEALPTPL